MNASPFGGMNDKLSEEFQAKRLAHREGTSVDGAEFLQTYLAKGEFGALAGDLTKDVFGNVYNASKGGVDVTDAFKKFNAIAPETKAAYVNYEKYLNKAKESPGRASTMLSGTGG